MSKIKLSPKQQQLLLISGTNAIDVFFSKKTTSFLTASTNELAKRHFVYMYTAGEVFKACGNKEFKMRGASVKDIFSVENQPDAVAQVKKFFEKKVTDMMLVDVINGFKKSNLYKDKIFGSCIASFFFNIHAFYIVGKLIKKVDAILTNEYKKQFGSEPEDVIIDRLLVIALKKTDAYTKVFNKTLDVVKHVTENKTFDDFFAKYINDRLGVVEEEGRTAIINLEVKRQEALYAKEINKEINKALNKKSFAVNKGTVHLTGLSDKLEKIVREFDAYELDIMRANSPLVAKKSSELEDEEAFLTLSDEVKQISKNVASSIMKIIAQSHDIHVNYNATSEQIFILKLFTEIMKYDSDMCLIIQNEEKVTQTAHQKKKLEKEKFFIKISKDKVISINNSYGEEKLQQFLALLHSSIMNSLHTKEQAITSLYVIKEEAEKNNSVSKKLQCLLISRDAVFDVCATDEEDFKDVFDERIMSYITSVFKNADNIVGISWTIADYSALKVPHQSTVVFDDASDENELSDV